MEQLCKNCQHWTRSKEDGIDLKYGSCNSLNLIAFEYNYEPPNEHQLGFMTYDSAEYYSGENFGCIHFENKLAQVTDKL